MKKIFLCALLTLFPVAAQAQSLDSIEACQDLKAQISEAVNEANPIDTLLTDKDISRDVYLEQLYQAVQILAKSGEMFFKAADLYESDCITALKQANKVSNIREVYDLYIVPVKKAYAFFNRAKTQAIRLGREKDVETFVKAIREYEDSVLKIAANCENTLQGQANAETCRILSAQLEDALK